MESRNYSDATAYEIDKEVRRIVDECYRRARTVLAEQRDVLQRIARALLDRETLNSKDIDALVAGESPTDIALAAAA